MQLWCFRALRKSGDPARVLDCDTQRSRDGVENTVHVLDHLIVPEAHHPIAMCLQPQGSSLVFGLTPIVLSAVDLDDQFLFEAGEVGDEVSDRHLPAKEVTADLSQADAEPEFLFGLGHLAAQALGAL